MQFRSNSSATANLVAVVMTFLVLPAVAGAAPAPKSNNSKGSSVKVSPTKLNAKDHQAEANKDFARISALSARYSKDSELKQGMAEMKQRLNSNPHDIDALICKALLEARQRNQSAALADLNQAIKEKPNLYYAYLIRSAVNEQAGDVNKALADMTKAYEISHYDDLLRARGQIQYRAKNYKAAIADLSNGLDEYKEDSSQCYFYLYQSHLHLKDWKNAVHDAQVMVDIEPTAARRHELLADAADLAGDKKTAASAYRRASQLYLDEGKSANSNVMMKKANSLDMKEKTKTK